MQLPDIGLDAITKPRLKPEAREGDRLFGASGHPTGFLKRVAPSLPTIGVMPQDDSKLSHSNSPVVIDKDGHIAAITHMINSVIWGPTRIVEKDGSIAVEPLKLKGLAFHDVPQATAAGMRGTVATVAFDPKTKMWQATGTADLLLPVQPIDRVNMHSCMHALWFDEKCDMSRPRMAV